MLKRQLPGFMAALGLALGLTLFITFPTVQASTGQGAIGTFSLLDRGQGVWVGGSLYSDGTAQGGGALVIGNAKDGQLVSQWTATSWSPIGPDAVSVCFDVKVLKNSIGIPITSGLFCTPPLPVTGAGAPILLIPGTDLYVKVQFS